MKAVMNKTHTLPANAMSKPASAIVPNPDLLDLIRRNLPGEEGNSMRWSVNASLQVRIASLAGKLVNGLAADIRNPTVDSFNDCLAALDEANVAQNAFEAAGLKRQPMIESLSQLLAFRNTLRLEWADHMGGEDKLPETIWSDSVKFVANAPDVTREDIELRWQLYVEQCGGTPLISKAIYDQDSIVELQESDAKFIDHIDAVTNIIELANTGELLPFNALDTRTQLSMLRKYAAEGENRMTLITAVLKNCTRRGVRGLKKDAVLRLRIGFADQCKAACTHHRFDEAAERTAPAAVANPSASLGSKEIAQRIKLRKQAGLQPDFVESPEAEALRVKAAKKAANAAKARERKAKAQTAVSLAEMTNDPV